MVGNLPRRNARLEQGNFSCRIGTTGRGKYRGVGLFGRQAVDEISPRLGRSQPAPEVEKLGRGHKNLLDVRLVLAV